MSTIAMNAKTSVFRDPTILSKQTALGTPHPYQLRIPRSKLSTARLDTLKYLTEPNMRAVGRYVSSGHLVCHVQMLE